MDRVFKSKVSWMYHLTIWILAFSTILSFIKGSSPLVMVLLLLSTLLSIHILLTTWYKITEDGYLIAHCSIFPEKRIAISEITAVEVTAMPVASYALSLDRIILYSGQKQWMLISPTDKKIFIRQLRMVHPEITVKDPMI